MKAETQAYYRTALNEIEKHLINLGILFWFAESSNPRWLFFLHLQMTPNLFKPNRKQQQLTEAVKKEPNTFTFVVLKEQPNDQTLRTKRGVWQSSIKEKNDKTNTWINIWVTWKWY